MRTKLPKWKYLRNIVSLALAIQVLLIAGLQPRGTLANPQSAGQNYRVNVPHLDGTSFTPAVFWFGKVDSTNNYADVRMDYKDDVICIYLHIIDRRLWYDTTDNPTLLPQWDAVSIYLNQDGNVGTNPGSNAYRLEMELYNNLQASYRGNGTSWVAASALLDPLSKTEWRGADGPNSNADSEGWVAYLYIPFTSLGMSGPPTPGTQWGLGVVLHDRDDAAGSIRQDTTWPETMDPNIPSTWGQLSFGWPANTPPALAPLGTVTIRQGLNGTSVVDAEVGGHTTCGNGGYNKWADWGNTNYAGINQVNVQNEWDISDWPCFSKFYVTFPVTAIPSGSTIISATLTMNLFGTAGGGQWGDPPVSYIEALAVGSDWDESTITWNNAPLASENISGIWVPPVVGAYNWDVSRAVTQAYDSGSPVRLVLYSIDGSYHTGKYFYSSDSTDWNGETRPTLKVVYGNGISCSSPSISCTYYYLPLLTH